MADNNSEDLLEHPVMRTLAQRVDNVHWLYHIAEQLLLVEAYEQQNPDKRIVLDWNRNNIDSLMYWKPTPQGTAFWSRVADIEQGYSDGEELPWMVNGKLQFAHRDKIL